MHFSRLAAILGVAVLCRSQDTSFCKDDDCDECPTSLATTGTGYPKCVIYDTETVFGGLGFKEGKEKIEYLARGNFADPCGGGPGSFIVRSPASIEAVGCGTVVFFTQKAQCSSELLFKDTFMVQFCCGMGDCQEAGVPFRRRRGDDDHLVGSGGGLQGAYLKFANGTFIPPLAVSGPPPAAKRCEGYKEGSYVADGDTYYKTFDTQIVYGSVGPYTQDTTVTITYDQTVSKTTTFSLSIGDPWGILTASTGLEFTEAEKKGFSHELPVPAGQQGLVGFTPYFICTSGSIETCDSVKNEGESCAPVLLENGSALGDYTLVQS